MRNIRIPRTYLYPTRAILVVSLTLVSLLAGWNSQAQAPRANEELLRHVKFLASDETTGRGVDTPGIKLARDYIAREFAKNGLQPGGDNSSYLQSFTVATGVSVKQPSSLTLSDEDALTLNDDWTPLGFSTSAAADATVVFAGYGITANDYGYNDYDGIDVKGKVVLVLRYEPPPKNAKSPFRTAPDYSTYATLRTKANNARDHGAAGMILVDLNNRADDKTELLTTRGSLARGGNSLVAAQVKRRVIEKWLTSHGVSLESLKEKIDRDEKPASMAIPNATAKLQVTLEEHREQTENVIGVLPGTDPALRDQHIVIGAHYDHLGLGEFGARNLSAVGQIHHGADDNASGAAVVLDLAGRFSQSANRPKRSLVFVAFSGEELGLFGSRFFVEHFTFLPATKAMINLDMVGRLRDNRLTASGARSGSTLSAVVNNAGREMDLTIGETNDVGRSDHMSFYNKKIPVVHFTTGVHPDYHRPSDTWDKLNTEGMSRIADLAQSIIAKLANSNQPINFVSLPSRPPSEQSDDRRAIAVYLGTMPDYGADSDGVRITGVANDSPAARAGLREGDVIVKLADARIQNIEDLTAVLRSHKPGDAVEITILRSGATVKLTATLQARS
jgi:aminopeptidase YwaD